MKETTATEAFVTDSALSYYVTTSEVTDATNGLTSESAQKHTALLSGRIQGEKDSPLIQVNDGTFNMESGALLGKNDTMETRGIQASGGTLNLNGGYIVGFYQNDEKKHFDTTSAKDEKITLLVKDTTDEILIPELITEKSGAGVSAVNAVVNASGTVLAGNRIHVSSYSYGGDYGAVMIVRGKSSLTVNGSVFSGNRIDTDEESYRKPLFFQRWGEEPITLIVAES